MKRIKDRNRMRTEKGWGAGGGVLYSKAIQRARQMNQTGGNDETCSKFKMA